MKMAVLLLAILFAFLIPTYGQQKAVEPEVISIDLKNEVEKDMDLDLVSVIPLQTEDECLLSWIGDFDYYKGRFYFLNNNRFKEPGVFVFNENGEFIQKTGIGKGPGEMIEPFAFCVMDQTDQVYVHDQAQGPSFIFDLDLNFKEKVNHEYRFISGIEHIGDDKFLVSHHMPVSREDPDNQKCYCYTLYAEDFTMEQHLDVFTGREQSISLTHSISNWEDKVLFVVPYSLNVYQLCDTTVNVKYKIELGSSVMDEKKLNKVTDREYRELLINKKLAMLGGVYETDEWLGLKFYYDLKSRFFLRSKRNQVIYDLNRISNVPSGFNFKTLTDDGHILGHMEAVDFMEYQEETGIRADLQVEETDNPIILIFKIDR